MTGHRGTAAVSCYDELFSIFVNAPNKTAYIDKNVIINRACAIKYAVKVVIEERFSHQLISLILGRFLSYMPSLIALKNKTRKNFVRRFVFSLIFSMGF